MAAEVLYETFLQGSRVEILLNFCAKNPPHRQAEKRWQQAINFIRGEFGQ